MAISCGDPSRRNKSTVELGAANVSAEFESVVPVEVCERVGHLISVGDPTLGEQVDIQSD